MNICFYKHDPHAEVTIMILEAYQRAFEELGHRILVLSHDMGNYSPEQAREFAKRFVNFRAELAMCYGFSAMPQINGGFFFRKHGIPLTILCFDNPFFGLNSNLIDEIKRHPDYYHLFVWDSYYLDLLRKLFKNCYPIRHAAEFSDLFDDSANEEIEFHREVAFAGSMTDFQLLRSDRNKNNDPINIVIDEVLEKKVNNAELNVIDVIRDALRRMPGFSENDPRYSATGYYLHKSVVLPVYREGLGRYRCNVLNQLSMFDVHYYGPASWPASHITFHNPVGYLDDLPEIYKSTAVNLDIPAFQSINSINNRFFDVAASVSLVLTPKNSDLMMIFDDFEAITYTGIDDLKEKIKFYLENPETRNEVAQKLHRCVRQNHTYNERVLYMLDTLSSKASHS